MIIAKLYANILKNTQPYTNEEYLELQLLQLQNVFVSEPSAIKNIQREFLAFSNEFATAFAFDHNALGKRQQDLLILSESTCQEIEKQEQAIITTKIAQDTLFHVKVKEQHTCYLMRKRPLINPSTQDVVGILILAAKVDASLHRKAMYKRFLSEKTSTSFIKNKPFTEEQQLIVNCLLLGFHQRKEIAAILNKVTENEVDDIQVRNQLHRLYDRYHCNSTHELVNLISSDEGFSPSMHGILTSDGSFLLKK